MVNRHLKRSKHQRRRLHLHNPKPSDTKNLPAESHHVGEEHDMSRINRHPVASHRVLDLGHDGIPSCFDAQRFFHGDDVIARHFGSLDARDSHHREEIITFNQQIMATSSHIVDHGTTHILEAFDNHGRKQELQKLNVRPELQFVRAGPDRNSRSTIHLQIHGLQLEFGSRKNSLTHLVGSDIQLDLVNQGTIELDHNKGVVSLINFFDVPSHLA
mmetsp:Transcript_2442/g.6526  ORF Transcript_2442/g.6526 Transcript_2442/m.6526 type:complete len:215 (-) Transcript_2442:1124-1768(-)